MGKWEIHVHIYALVAQVSPASDWIVETAPDRRTLTESCRTLGSMTQGHCENAAIKELKKTFLVAANARNTS
jgi:hypothetical protein